MTIGAFCGIRLPTVSGFENGGERRFMRINVARIKGWRLTLVFLCLPEVVIIVPLQRVLGEHAFEALHIFI